MTSIYSLPNEILSSICSQLGTPDLLHCAQVSQHFRDLINNDALLQYRAELNMHGMTDVLQEDTPVATKLRTLKLYGERFHRDLAAVECAALANPGSDADRTFGPFVSSDGSIVHFTRTQGSGSRCVVDKLPSTTRGIGASRWTAPLPGAANMDVLAMDVSQDLTVAIEHRHDKEILIHFLTAAAGEPHPLAAKPLLDATGTSASVDSPDAYYHVQSVHISGSNVAWVIPSFISGLDTLQCWNWKTGFLVWERQCDGLAGYTFLDSRFVLTVVHRGQEPLLCIHDLESRADGGDTTAGPVCSLELPRASAGYVEVVHVQSRTTTDSRNAAVPFVRDPMSTAVVLQLAVGRDSEGATSDIIVMIPHRTMYDQIKEAISSSCGTQADRVVEWNMWGLSGAVVLDLPPKAQAAENGGWFVPPDVWPQSFGSRLGLLLCDSPDITSGVVVTVDVHPWAAKCARRYSGHLGHGVYRGGPTASSVDGPSPDVLRRLASMSKMSHALQVGPRIVFPPGQRPSRIITAHDGFAVAFEGDESEVGLRVFTV